MMSAVLGTGANHTHPRYSLLYLNFSIDETTELHLSLRIYLEDGLDGAQIRHPFNDSQACTVPRTILYV